MQRSKAGQFVYPALAVIVFFAAWTGASAAVGKEYILPSPAATFRALGEIMKDRFALILLATLLRSLTAFFTSFLLAALFCLLSALIRNFDRFLSPVVTFLRAVPTISVIMFALIFLSSDAAPVFIACLVLFPMMYTAFRAAYEETDRKLVEMAKIYKVSPARQTFRLYIPSMLPGSLAAVRSNAGLAVKLTVAAEVMAQTGRDLGIGVSMQMARFTLNTAELLAWTLAAIALSALLECTVWIIRKCAVKGELR